MEEEIIFVEVIISVREIKDATSIPEFHR